MKIYHIASEELREAIVELEKARQDVVDAINNGFSEEIINLRRRTQRRLQKEMEDLWAKAHGLRPK